jgi:hypothetical protein
MVTDPGFLGGVLLLAAGVAFVAFRVPDRFAQRFMVTGGLMLVVSGALLIWIARDRHRFRVTDVEVLTSRAYAGACPAAQPVRVRIVTAGGAGRVVLRLWADDDYQSPPLDVQVRDTAAFEVTSEVAVRRSGLSTVYATIEAPALQYKVASRFFRVACRAT